MDKKLKEIVKKYLVDRFGKFYFELKLPEYIKDVKQIFRAGYRAGVKSSINTPKHETVEDKLDKAYKSLDHIRQVLEHERERYDMYDDTMSKWAIDNVLGQVLPNLDEATKYMNVRRAATHHGKPEVEE